MFHPKIAGLVVAACLLFVAGVHAPKAAAAPTASNVITHVAGTDIGEYKTPDTPDKGYCGGMDASGGDNRIKLSIDIGCKGIGNPILDALFAIIRFLTLGVGLVLIGSMIVAGIQYTASRGDPQATAKAIGRMTSNVTALLLFIFTYAILNWVVPAGLLK